MADKKEKRKKGKRSSAKKRFSATGIPKALDAMMLAETYLMAARSAIDTGRCDDRVVGEALQELSVATEAVRIAGGKLDDFASRFR